MHLWTWCTENKLVIYAAASAINKNPPPHLPPSVWHTQTNIYTYTCVNTQTHACTHSDAHACTHTHILNRCAEYHKHTYLTRNSLSHTTHTRMNYTLNFVLSECKKFIAFFLFSAFCWKAARDRVRKMTGNRLMNTCCRSCHKYPGVTVLMPTLCSAYLT